MSRCSNPNHAEDSWWEYDAQGIPLCKVCQVCEKNELSMYRPEILSGYTQEDVDEPIDEEPSIDLGFEVHPW